jgi:DNA-binding HxlR family transcriptional regulator
MSTSTAARRKEQAKVAYDAYLANCPARRVLDRVSDKWVTLLLNGLADGPRRYAELGRIVAGVSEKMLTQTLRGLERDGLVTRTVTPSIPIRVDYALTDLGTSLLPVTRELKAWAEAHIAEIDAARTNYDLAASN